MVWGSDAELEAFVLRFRRRTVPKAEWTHAAHLAVGTWHVHHFGRTRAITLLRTGIRALNDSHGVANSDTGGYHETITCAYAHLISDFLANCSGPTPLVERVQALLASPLAGKDALLEYYSRDRLMSVEARRGWTPPDRGPLPSLNLGPTGSAEPHKS